MTRGDEKTHRSTCDEGQERNEKNTYNDDENERGVCVSECVIVGFNRAKNLTTDFFFLSNVLGTISFEKS